VDDALADRLLRIYADTRTIAVVGASADETKPSFRIPRYLRSQGYAIRPVNPRGGVILGEPVAASRAEVPPPVDVVEVVRPPAEAPEVARRAVAAGARVVWLQTGIESEEARRIAEDAALTVVMDRCMGAMHAELGLGPGPQRP
jgi:predicted CoA-binding protein